MKYRLSLLSFGLLLFAFTPYVSAQDKELRKDSLRRVISMSEGKEKLKSYTRLSYLYMAEIEDARKMDTLLAILSEIEGEAIRQGDVSQQGMAYGNTIIAFKNRFEYDEVIRRAPAVLDFYIKNSLWKYYYQIHMQLIDAYNQKEAYEEAAKEAEKMYITAKEQENDGGMATALYATANIYNIQGRNAEQERCLRECIGLLKEVEGYDNILTQAYAFLIISLRVQERHSEIASVIPGFEKAVLRFEKASGSVQYEARANLYVAMMYNFIETKEYDQAAAYLEKIKETTQNAISEVELHRAKALILLGRKEYAGALAEIESAIAENNEIQNDLNVSRKIKIKILSLMGRAEETLKLLDEIIATDRALHDVQVNARFDELRTRYEVDKHIFEKERNRYYFLFALAGCLLLIIFLGVAIYYNRIIARKNRSLYRQIKERDRLEEEFLLMDEQYEVPTQNGEATPGNEKETQLGECRQRELVARLRAYLIAEGNLAAADLSRDELVSALATNKNTLSEAVKAVTGKTPKDYIRIVQLEEARRIIDQHPELTIETVLEGCGFNAAATFYRLFRKHYGISPSEYRRLAATHG